MYVVPRTPEVQIIAEHFLMGIMVAAADEVNREWRLAQTPTQGRA